ncbi:MAG: MCP four helix bundle domain-containing protein, partial [Bacillota bacterium]
MVWFKNLKISAKLLYSFLFVACISVAIGTYSYFATQRVNKLTNSVTEKQVPSILYLGNMNTYLNAVAAAERGLLIEEFTKKNIRKTQYAVYDVKMKELIKNFEAYKNTPKEGKDAENWQKLSSYHTGWMELSAKYIQLNREMDLLLNQGLPFENEKVKAMQNRMAETFLNERETFLKYTNLLIDLTNQNWQETQLANTEIDKIINSSGLWMGVFTVLGFMIAVLTGIFISKLITKPVNEAKEAIKLLSVGSLKGNVNWAAKDELGEMGLMLNGFIRTLQKYIASIYDVADGKFTYVRQVKDDRNELAPALEKIVETLKDLI